MVKKIWKLRLIVNLPAEPISTDLIGQEVCMAAVAAAAVMVVLMHAAEKKAKNFRTIQMVEGVGVVRVEHIARNL